MAIVDIAYEAWQKDFEAECPDLFKNGSLTKPGTTLRRDLMRTAYMAGKKAARQPVWETERLDRALGETIDRRDRYHEVADELAGHIARITRVEIGEHSSDNCPWENALRAAEEYKPAQAVDLGQFRKAVAFAIACLDSDDQPEYGQLESLLALIDGQA